MPNQAEEHIVSLVGYCHARPMYVACATGEWADAHGLTVQESLEDPFHLPPPVAPVGDAARRALGVGAARVPEVLLKFPRAGSPEHAAAYDAACRAARAAADADGNAEVRNGSVSHKELVS